MFIQKKFYISHPPLGPTWQLRPQLVNEFCVFSPPPPFSSGLRHLPLAAPTLSLRLGSLYTGDKLAYFSDTAKVLAVITNYEPPVSLTKMKR